MCMRFIKHYFKLRGLSKSGNPSPGLEICQRIPRGFFLTPNLDSKNLLPLLRGIVDIVGDLGGIVIRYSFAELRCVDAEGGGDVFRGVD